MHALVLSKFWDSYYAASPYNNLLQSNHNRFKLFATTGHDLLSDETLRDEIRKCDAVVVDDVLSPSMGWYTQGPKLCIGGDLHSHDEKGVEVRIKELTDNDFVLTGGIFAPELPQYRYMDKSYRERMIYLPNSTPRVEQFSDFHPYEEKPLHAQISGSISREVYPYRYHCSKFSSIHRVPMNEFTHNAFFYYISNYKVGVTCNSIFDYVIAKYFEIPFVGSVLVAPRFNPVEQELLGFVDGENVVFEDNPSMVPEMINDILRDPSYKDLAAYGKELVHACHTVTSRLDYIDGVITMIKSGHFVTEDATHFFKQLREKQENEYYSPNSDN